MKASEFLINLDNILAEANKEDEYEYNLNTFFDYDNLYPLGCAIEDLFPNCSVNSGCQSLTIIDDNDARVLKLTRENLNILNDFYDVLPDIYTPFFAPVQEEASFEVGNITYYIFSQVVVDCDKKGASSNTYKPDWQSKGNLNADDQLLATMGEGLDPMHPEDAINKFLSTILDILDEPQFFHKLRGDFHGGNWGMSYGHPVIFDPFFIGEFWHDDEF